MSKTIKLEKKPKPEVALTRIEKKKAKKKQSQLVTREVHDVEK
jgi:hypothetical protein